MRTLSRSKGLPSGCPFLENQGRVLNRTCRHTHTHTHRSPHRNLIASLFQKPCNDGRNVARRTNRRTKHMSSSRFKRNVLCGECRKIASEATTSHKTLALVYSGKLQVYPCFPCNIWVASLLLKPTSQRAPNLQRDTLKPMSACWRFGPKIRGACPMFPNELRLKAPIQTTSGWPDRAVGRRFPIKNHEKVTGLITDPQSKPPKGGMKPASEILSPKA